MNIGPHAGFPLLPALNRRQTCGTRGDCGLDWALADDGLDADQSITSPLPYRRVLLDVQGENICRAKHNPMQPTQCHNTFAEDDRQYAYKEKREDESGRSLPPETLEPEEITRQQRVRPLLAMQSPASGSSTVAVCPAGGPLLCGDEDLYVAVTAGDRQGHLVGVPVEHQIDPPLSDCEVSEFNPVEERRKHGTDEVHETSLRVDA